MPSAGHRMRDADSSLQSPRYLINAAEARRACRSLINIGRWLLLLHLLDLGRRGRRTASRLGLLLEQVERGVFAESLEVIHASKRERNHAISSMRSTRSCCPSAAAALVDLLYRVSLRGTWGKFVSPEVGELAASPPAGPTRLALREHCGCVGAQREQGSCSWT